VLQLFDSWAGLLSPADYREFVLPHSRAALAAVEGSGVPLIHFATGSAGLLELMYEAGGDVIGLDWRVDLEAARRRLGEGVCLQGNLDPVTLLAEPKALEARAVAVLKSAAGRPVISSTSVMACCRRPRPTTCDAWSTWYMNGLSDLRAAPMADGREAVAPVGIAQPAGVRHVAVIGGA